MTPPVPPIYSIHNDGDLATVAQTYGLTTLEIRTLHDESVAAKRLAYCPYSQFRVGAALLVKGPGPGSSPSETEEDVRRPPRVVRGANVENASFPICTCAERVAIVRAIAEDLWVRWTTTATETEAEEGKTKTMTSFRALAVATDIAPPASPCGMCRQCIREFCNLDMPILMFDKDSKFSVLKLEELLPLSFGPEALPRPSNRTST